MSPGVTQQMELTDRQTGRWTEGPVKENERERERKREMMITLEEKHSSGDINPRIEQSVRPADD